MSMTLRQLQKMISASRRNVKATYGEEHSDDFYKFGRLFSREIGDAAAAKNFIQGGTLVGICDCGCKHRCAANADRFTSFIDSLAKRYGASTTLEDVIRQFQADEARRREQQRQKSESGERGERNEKGDKQSSQSSTPTEPSEWEDDDESQTPTPAQQQAAAAAAGQAKRAAAAEKAKAAQAVLDDLRQQEKTAQTAAQLQQAKRQLKEARRRASFVRVPGAPSLESRRAVSGQTARMRAVAPALRVRMARLIDRLVGQSGAVGGDLGPTPILSARTLVKRMLSKRPLANALKEDIVTGRPVTLFLPDVSQSCSETSQDACDLANAAGYSGVPGSDVLVFPHSNGCVAEGDDCIDDGASYTPWFNGKPVRMTRAEQEWLFDELLTGKSKYRVRVVVALGDHDAVDMYAQVAALKTITRIVWLHNAGEEYGVKRLRLDDPQFLPEWQPESQKKLSLVSGCTTCGSMMAGFDMATK